MGVKLKVGDIVKTHNNTFLMVDQLSVQSLTDNRYRNYSIATIEQILNDNAGWKYLGKSNSLLLKLLRSVE